MHAAKLTFRRPPTRAVRDHDTAVYSLLAAWHKHGQTIGDPVVARTDDAVEVYTQIATPDALRTENDNLYSAQYRGSLEQDDIEVEIIGDVSEAPNACSCTQPSAYALYVPLLRNDLPPVCCLDCCAPVPLFRLPVPDGHEHLSLLNWQSNYLAVEQIWLSSGFGEHLAARQLSRHDSALSREGRQLCREYEAAVGAPFYYALLAREIPDPPKELSRRCPGCDSEWRLPESFHDFEFRCDDCRLLSELSPEAAEADE